MTSLPSLWVLGLLLAAPPKLHPPSADGAGHPITFDEAQAMAAETGAVQGLHEAARAKAATERGLNTVLGNPEFDAQVGYVVEPDPLMQGTYTQLGVRLPISLSGIAGAGRKAASAETRALNAEALAETFSRRLEIAATWLHLWSAQSALEFSRTEEALAKDLLSRVEAALPLGGTTQLEVAEARGYAAEARLAVLTSEGAAYDARLALNRALGLEAGRDAVAHGPPPSRRPIPDASQRERLIERAEQLPTVLQHRHAAEAARARIQEARQNAGWKLSVGAQGELQAGRYPAAHGLLTLTPPLFDTGAREAAQAASEAARSGGQEREARVAAHTFVTGALHEAEHTLAVLHTTEQSLVPALVEAARLTDLRFQHGQSSVLDVLRARRAVVAAQSRLVISQAEAALAAFRLQLLEAALR